MVLLIVKIVLSTSEIYPIERNNSFTVTNSAPFLET